MAGDVVNSKVYNSVKLCRGLTGKMPTIAYFAYTQRYVLV